MIHIVNGCHWQWALNPTGDFHQTSKQNMGITPSLLVFSKQTGGSFLSSFTKNFSLTSTRNTTSIWVEGEIRRPVLAFPDPTRMFGINAAINQFEGFEAELPLGQE
jgi:hypothetical protein